MYVYILILYISYISIKREILKWFMFSLTKRLNNSLRSESDAARARRRAARAERARQAEAAQGLLFSEKKIAFFKNKNKNGFMASFSSV